MIRLVSVDLVGHALDVQLDEYIRLLGFPRGWELRDRALELAGWAKDWYAQHGRPWTATTEFDEIAVAGDEIRIGTEVFTSPRLASRWRDAEANRATVAAVSAGPEVDEEAQRLWRDDRPDEYFFLDVYGSAVVEHLVTAVGAQLCAKAESREQAVLPHYSPGYPDWAIEDQSRLLALLGPAPSGSSTVTSGVPLDVLSSGMLRPKKSLLAVFGLTPRRDLIRPLTDLIPCETCAFGPCGFRRAPYRHAAPYISPELAAIAARDQPTAAPVRYSVNRKALERWRRERLTLETRADGSVDAHFRYEGTTCTNMGRALAFDYRVGLGTRRKGYPLLTLSCAPAAGDEGHTFMCKYISGADALMGAIARERPLQGRPLADAIEWTRPNAPAGCFCDAASREHKWGLVLETIHYALHAE